MDDLARRALSVFKEVCDLDGDALSEALHRQCGDERELRARVEGLLRRESEEGGLLGDTGLGALNLRVASEAAAALGATGLDGAWLPREIGPYRVLEQLGSGGMGVVYAAEQSEPRRAVAIKVVHPLLADEQRLLRLRKEIEVLGRLHHPNIAQVFDAGSADLGRGAQPYLVMELVDGIDVHTWAERAKLDVRGRLRLLATIADAVHHAHERGVVHRDLKPDNILVTPEGTPKIVDFGIARVRDASSDLATLVTEEGQVLGTLAYMAPEQVDPVPGSITRRVDVYALGVLAFQLLTGRTPHDVAGCSVASASRLLLEQEPVRLGRILPGLAGDVETVVGKALEKEPGRRYDSAAALAADLRAFLEDRPIAARPPSRAYLARKFVRRNKALVAGTVSTFAAVLVGLAAALFLLDRAEEQRALAEANAQDARRRERETVDALLGAVHEKLEAGDLWGAALLHNEVDPDTVEWPWRFLDAALPELVPPSMFPYRLVWVDEETIGQSTERGFRTFELGSYRELETYEETRGLHPADTNGVFAGLFVEQDRLGAHAIGLFDFRRREFAHFFRAPPSQGEWRRMSAVVDESGRFLVFSADDANGLVVHADGAPILELPSPTDTPVGLYPSPDGTRFAAHTAGRLWLYETATGREIGAVAGLTRESVLRAFYSGDGKRLYTWAEGYQLAVIDVESGRLLELRPEIRSDLASAGLSADGALLATRSDRTVQVWRLSDYELLHEQDIGMRCVPRFSPAGRRLLCHTQDVAACVLDWSAELVPPERLGTDDDPRARTFEGHGQALGQIAVSPDGRLVASLSPTDRWIRVWDIDTRRPLAHLERSSSPYDSHVRLMAFSGDGLRLLALTAMPEASGFRLVDWDLVTGAVSQAPLQVDPLDAATYLEPFLARLGPGASGRLGRAAYRPAAGEDAWVVTRETPDRTSGRGWRAFRPTDRLWYGLAVSATTDQVAAIRDRVVHVSRGGEEVARLLADGTCVAYSPDGELLAVGGIEGRIHLFDAVTLDEVLSFHGHDDFIDDIAWSASGDRLISASFDRRVRVWDARSRREREADRARLERERAAWASLDEPGLLQALEDADSVEGRGSALRALLERRATPPPVGVEVDETELLLTYAEHGAYVYHLAISPDGRTVVSMAPHDPRLLAWDLATGETRAALPRRKSPHDLAARSSLIAFRTATELVATTEMPDSSDPEVVTWDVATGEVQRRQVPPVHGQETHGAWIGEFLEALGPDVAGRLGRTAHRVRGGEALVALDDRGYADRGAGWRKLPMAERLSRGVSVSPDGRRIAVGLVGRVRVIDGEDEHEVAELAVDGYGCAFSPDGALLAVGGADGRIHVFETVALEPVRVFQAHRDYVFSLAWSPSEPRLVSASGDGSVRVWDAGAWDSAVPSSGAGSETQDS